MENFKKASIIIFIALFAGLIFSCGKKVPLTPEQKVYAGNWVAGDGTFVKIYFDGGGDLKTSNANITGGNTIITADTITIGMGPIKKSFKITKKPKEVKGSWVIELDGVTYTKK